MKMMMLITLRNHERRLQATLLEQRGSTCEVPQMDPFDKEIMQFFEVVDKIYCPGFDWVACHHSICKVKPEILETHRDVSCLYKDIIYITDYKAEFGEIYSINGSEEYQLVQSDHVHVKCTGIVRKDGFPLPSADHQTNGLGGDRHAVCRHGVSTPEPFYSSGRRLCGLRGQPIATSAC
ncbi:unnamed protein product [Plutella xylostella]|uniref:(diamondback moth) hypothetical protein n=1 Tax=Plutella xylostella TaxID=51655 RepID=A0A8S4ELU1_PLUXY|nr:unnamed protein product [Plutella xylostella]